METIQTIKPNVWVLEKVPTLVGRHREVLDLILVVLKATTDVAGRQLYTNYVKMIDSSSCGLPQKRKRLHIISYQAHMAKSDAERCWRPWTTNHLSIYSNRHLVASHERQISICVYGISGGLPTSTQRADMQSYDTRDAHRRWRRLHELAHQAGHQYAGI